MSKKYIDHNQYYLTIYNVNGKTDTLIFTLWREDFNKVAIGDKIIKEERSLNAFLRSPLHVVVRFSRKFLSTKLKFSNLSILSICLVM
jgi:hypothetical protein